MVTTFSWHLIRPRPDDVFTGSPPLAFTFGLGQLLIFPLRAGAAALLLEDGSPPTLAEAIVTHDATVVGTAPTAYRALLDVAVGTPRRSDDASRPARPCPGPRSTVPRAHSRQVDGIGATEMLHIFISAADDDIRPGATGVPVPGYEAWVVDDDGRPVNDGNVTGDAYLRDEDGYFWYQARTDDMIISSGYNIAGPEVEAALLAHPAAAEAGVVGVPDADRARSLRPTSSSGGGRGTDALAGQLQDHVKATIAPYKYPRRVEFVDELPRTQTGKVQRFKLRDRA